MMMLEHPPLLIFQMPSEVEEEEEVKSNNVWKHAIDILFRLSPLHPDGKTSKHGWYGPVLAMG